MIAKWQAEVLGAVDPSTLGPDVPAVVRTKLRVRRSTVQATLSYLAARTGDLPLSQQASLAAKRELLLADRSMLDGDDRLAYDEAALRTATVRWAHETTAPQKGSTLDVEIVAGAPGQTCVRVKKRAPAPEGSPPFEHCTYAVVWPSSIRVAPHDAAIAMITQPLVGWSELLLLRPKNESFVAETVTPMTIDPDLGYVELAGFSPDGSRLLVVREARATGPLGAPNTLAPWMQKTFQVMTTDALHIEKQTPTFASLATFRRWATADWQHGTLALR